MLARGLDEKDPQKAQAQATMDLIDGLTEAYQADGLRLKADMGVADVHESVALKAWQARRGINPSQGSSAGYVADLLNPPADPEPIPGPQ